MNSRVQHDFAQRCHSQRGFSLVELMVSIGLLSLVMTLAGAGLFQVMGSQRWWLADSVATKDLRHSLSKFGDDAAKAEIVDLADAGGPVSSLAITWSDANGGLNVSTFAQAGDTFTRELGGTTSVLARNVTAVAFNRTGKTLKLDLTVAAAPGETKTESLQVYAWRLP